MKKTQICITLDHDVYKRAKDQIDNMSGTVNRLLDEYLSADKGAVIETEIATGDKKEGLTIKEYMKRMAEQEKNKPKKPKPKREQDIGFIGKHLEGWD